MNDPKLELRIIEYAIEHLCSEINKYQKEIIDIRLRLKHFPESALSDATADCSEGMSLLDETKENIRYASSLEKILLNMVSDYEQLVIRKKAYRMKSHIEKCDLNVEWNGDDSQRMKITSKGAAA